jgi:hypothetical protein
VVDRTASQMTNQKRVIQMRRVVLKDQINLALLGIRKTILILMIAAVKRIRLD